MASRPPSRKDGGKSSNDEIHASPLVNPPPITEPLSRLPSSSPSPLYTIFTKREKVVLVMLASLAAFLSPITTSVYYPAIKELSNVFNVSIDLINLTITMYLLFQGLAPTVIGSVSDAVGRRPAYLICFTIYVAANLGMALQDTFAGLMVLRCVQSAGSSGTVALANALVSDIVTTSERGSYIGYASIGALLGPALGPIIGGLLNQFLGWRSIFWFLVILSSIIFVIFIIILPETCRAVVGNGSLPPQPWNISLITYLTHRRFIEPNPEILIESPPRAPRRPINLLGTIQIIFSKEAFCILLYTGLLFGGFNSLAASLPSDLTHTFSLNSLQIGLCYIPLGSGSMVAAICIGKTIDWNFRRVARAMNYPILKGRQSDLSKFPIEKARLQIVAPLVGFSGLFMLAYGWVLRETRTLAGPLVLLFFLGFGISGSFMGLSALAVDLYPKTPGTVTAAANWVRCWMGAGAVAAVGPLVGSIGTGWVAVCVVGCWTVASPLLWIVVKWGPGWREERRIAEEETAKEEEERIKMRDLEKRKDDLKVTGK